MHFPHLYLPFIALSTNVFATTTPPTTTTYPPFPPSILQEFSRLAALPSLIDVTSLFANIDPSIIQLLMNTTPINPSESQPNPIAETFPNYTTGTINGTFFVVPLEYELVKSIIPSKYQILKEKIAESLPGFPEDQYPLLLGIQLDHDIKGGGVTTPDFSQVQFRFPFIDLLGDGTPFSFIPTFIVGAGGGSTGVAGQAVAKAGAEAYGTDVVLGGFEPRGDAYQYEDGAGGKRNVEKGRKRGVKVFKDGIIRGPMILETSFVDETGREGEVGEYPISFYATVLNQPLFSNEKPGLPFTCDNMIRFFNTSITQGEFRPRGVKGDVELVPAQQSGIKIFPDGLDVKGVRGARFDTAFIENNFRRCEDLSGEGYQGV